ncbi:MAG TPA: trypsin-like peptidase domain-containing protein [Clostridia bacterium]|nr:trypsin-like peptidase domain-containing protein [Clostridia bacterium]
MEDFNKENENNIGNVNSVNSDNSNQGKIMDIGNNENNNAAAANVQPENNGNMAPQQNTQAGYEQPFAQAGTYQQSSPAATAPQNNQTAAQQHGQSGASQQYGQAGASQQYSQSGYQQYGQSYAQAAASQQYSQPGFSQPENKAYYKENIKKSKQGRVGTGQLILVSVLSAVLGASAMFSASTFLGPVIQPSVNSWLGNTDKTAATSGNNGVYKKVEITQSTSPVEAIVEKVSPSIVGIEVTVQAQGSDFFFNLGQSGVGYGSGIIVKSDGYIMTNNHVIESALNQNSNTLANGSKIQVVLSSNKDKPYTAQVVGRDSKTDIAVLKIDAANLPAAELGNSDNVKPGELAVAIGNPEGFDFMNSVTAGIISGINRTVQTEDGQEYKLIQTDAAINPGNSGGALVNSQGQVVGINTVKIASTEVEGIGFAIPINEANKIAQSLMEFKYVKGRPYLGLSIDPRFNSDIAKQYKVPNGLLVYEVLPLTAAYKAGIQPGDIITKFDGKTVTAFSELEDQKNTHKPGDKVAVEVYRNGKTLNLTVTLDEENNSVSAN